MRCASRATGERVGARALILSASVLLGAGCGVLAPLEGTPPCEDYATVVQPVLDADCVSCHGPARAEGGYRLDTREGAIALRPDGSSRVVGASASFSAAVQGTLASHTAVDAGVLVTWATSCQGNRGKLLYHQAGWGTPGASAFHGLQLRASGYPFAACQECHGDLAADAGTAQVSCQSCHAAGVTACTTCHGSANAAPPRSLGYASATSTTGVGAHQAHVTDGPLHKALSCDACHPAVTQAFQPNHFPTDGGAPDGVAEVQLAGSGATWSRGAATCAGTTCHAPVFPGGSAEGTHLTPVWTSVGQGQAACGSCHSTPPAAPHPQDAVCARCHPASPADGGLFVPGHVNGAVDLGHVLADGGAPGNAVECTACHAMGAPFYDTLRRTNLNFASVGVHDIHLNAARHLTNPVACVDCHGALPQSVLAAGHLTTTGVASVFPGGTLASADNATPTFNTPALTCSNTYCHGGGTKGNADTSAGIVRTPSWTAGFGLVCGSCHGTPPSSGIHNGATLTTCVNCHAASVDGSGRIKFTSDGGVSSTTHLNGRIETN